MKNEKKGFTIVELVIVIAVIAILAAVLIPTFSGIVSKANLSADKQAVRAMNQALADWEAQHNYAKPADVESCYQLLADTGYNTDSWTCLEKGYQVYWFKQDNRMILYNAALARIEYPEEYVGTNIMIDAENEMFIYNANHVKAQQFDMGLSSAVKSGETLQATNKIKSVTSLTKKDANINSNEGKNLENLETAISSNSKIQQALSLAANAGQGGVVYQATREVVSADTGNAFASLQVVAVTGENVQITSSGEMKENLYCISVVTKAGATDTEIKAAKKAAGEYVYNVFDQMTTGKVTSNAVILIDAGTEIDCSTCEWAPCKTFSGYFGTTDASNPIVISGARLTKATGHSQTVAFNGSGSKYFVTGFFGTLYGDTTIENVRFENISISTPANDYELTASDIEGKKVNTRNTVGIIGGIIDNYSESNSKGTPANVTLKNIVVASSCSITGAGCAGGLVGYIGSNKEKDLALIGNITIDGCEVHCDVTSTDDHSSNGYKAVGGLIGFACRVNANTNITIKGCTFDGKLNGYGCLGAAVGAFQNGPTVKFEGTMNLANANLNENGTALAARSLIGYTQDVGATSIGKLTTISSTATLNLKEGLAMTGDANGTVGYNWTQVEDAETHELKWTWAKQD